MTNKELEVKFNDLTKLVSTLVEKLPQTPQRSVSEVKTEPLDGEERINRVLGGKSDPIPEDYTKVVQELLNGEFGLHVKASKDLPTFKFTVLVPKKYSKEQNLDVRPKVITYADGLVGVKSWCERVLSSFPSDVRDRIIRERTTTN